MDFSLFIDMRKRKHRKRFYLRLIKWKSFRQIEIHKNIIISDKELRIFEQHLLVCDSEPEAAVYILGAIRRYTLQLEEAVSSNFIDDVSLKSNIVHEETVITEQSALVNENFTTECLVVCAPKQTLTIVRDNSVIELTDPITTGQSPLVIENIMMERHVVCAPELIIVRDNALNEFQENTTDKNEQVNLVVEPDTVNDQVTDNNLNTMYTMETTNTFIHNEPYIDDSELNTTRDNKSFFLVYGEINDIIVGCEFTLKRKGKYPRFECRTCRKITDKLTKSGTMLKPEDKAAVVTFSENVIREFKKESHHPDCRVEYCATALARSYKNAAVVYKSKYGGTSKQAYDTHSKILSVSVKNTNLTVEDVAQGFRTFEFAGSALKKSSKRKCAIKPENILMDDQGIIDKMSTRIMKTVHGEEDDFFLIGQDSDVIVLGSKYMIHKFFTSKIAMSDGTFQMAPVGFKQCYMLWYIAEGKCKEEILNRSKAMLTVTFLLKGKSEKVYKAAFTILDDYRKSKNIPAPSFAEYVTDDEPAVRNVVSELYPNTKFSLCYFHHNQNVIKTLAEFKLTSYIRKCKDDEQLWFYGQIKKILVIPLLKENDVIPTFKTLSANILGFIRLNFSNPFEVSQFEKYFKTLEERYFSNPEKIALTCKYGKFIRSTNLVESTHCAFKKSSIIPKHGTVPNLIGSMKNIDLQYRTTAIDFEKNGAAALPKKRNRYAKQQAVISECTTKLDDHIIDVDEFLLKCAEATIHPKYYKLIVEATQRFENQSESNRDDEYEAEELIMAIFATENSNKRIRKICSKYFGDEWLN